MSNPKIGEIIIHIKLTYKISYGYITINLKLKMNNSDSIKLIDQLS